MSSVGLAPAGAAGSVRAAGAIGTSNAVRATGSQELWTPTGVPFPSSLPSGNGAASMELGATSCSASSFCAAVGTVFDTNDEPFPVTAVLSDGSWTSAVPPLPANAPPGYYSAGLQSISCPTDGVCAAVGAYVSTTADPTEDAQNGLMENLADGVWTPSEAPLPGDLGPYDASVNAVSCADATTCTAVGWVADGTTEALVFTWSSGNWQYGTLPVPSDAVDYSDGLQLASISCPDENDCTAVGGYETSDDASHGLILTLADGLWSATTAPFPDNAVTLGAGARVLESVDCPESDYCVAGGYYQIAPQSSALGSGIEAFLLVDQSGVWTAQQAPLPPDADGADLQSFVHGVDCPAVNACLAAGVYNFDYTDQAEEGMLLTQNPDDSWNATEAPLPPGGILPESARRHPGGTPTKGQILRTSPSASAGSLFGADRAPSSMASSMADPAVTSSTSLSGMSCDTEGFCAAAGSDGSEALVESGQIPSLPSVSGVSPPSGPTTGGTVVTVTGENFTPSTTVDFGTEQAASVTYVSATEMEATTPLVSTGGPVDVNVTSGSITSGASADDLFTYDGPNPAPTISSIAPATAAVGSSVTITGANFSGATGVSFSWNPATITAVTPTTITATVPPGADSGRVTVTTPDGTATSATIFVLSGMAVMTTGLEPWTTTTNYQVQLLATGGRPPYRWKKVSGKLPKGMTLSSRGILAATATPKTKPGRYPFTVQVTATGGGKGTHISVRQKLTIVVSG